MSYRQFHLQSGTRHLVCWLEDDRLLTLGRRLTLKGIADRVWTVVTRYNKTLDEPPEKRWQVGGLQ